MSPASFSGERYDSRYVAGSSTDRRMMTKVSEALGETKGNAPSVDERDRSALLNAPDSLPRHNLYVCSRDNLALANHLAVREYLRAHPEVANEYGELKKKLAQEFTHDMEGYVDGKTDLILEVLRDCGLQPDQLAAIERANRKPNR
jgi:GrpB-like predicted nucleotidyltransferase (UPF0157 family)